MWAEGLVKLVIAEDNPFVAATLREAVAEANPALGSSV
jgi:hypothetical protein